MEGSCQQPGCERWGPFCDAWGFCFVGKWHILSQSSLSMHSFPATKSYGLFGIWFRLSQGVLPWVGHGTGTQCRFLVDDVEEWPFFLGLTTSSFGRCCVSSWGNILFSIFGGVVGTSIGFEQLSIVVLSIRFLGSWWVMRTFLLEGVWGFDYLCPLCQRLGVMIAYLVRCVVCPGYVWLSNCSLGAWWTTWLLFNSLFGGSSRRWDLHDRLELWQGFLLLLGEVANVLDFWGWPVIRVRRCHSFVQLGWK